MPSNRFSVSVNDDVYKKINNIAKAEGVSVAEATRQLIEKGLDTELLIRNQDMLAKIVRESMQIVIKPHIERLASLVSKTGHMASRATLFNVYVVQKLLPNNKVNINKLYEDASKKAVEYMRTKTTDMDFDEMLKNK